MKKSALALVLLLALSVTGIAEAKSPVGKGKPAREANDVTVGANAEVSVNATSTCAHVPPGKLIAPGLKKKGLTPAIPTCQTLPYGIAKKLGLATSTPNNPTSTPDAIAPTISNVVANPSTSSVTLTWTTNEPTTSKVFFGTSTVTTSSAVVADNALSTSHSMVIGGLASSTAYNFRIEAKDAAGNAANSSQFSVTTSAVDTTPAVLSLVTATSTTSSITVTWTTDEPTLSKVYYSTSTLDSSALVITHNVHSTIHSVTIYNLTPATLHNFRIEATDAAGNVSTSTQQSISTLALPDTTAPVISGLALTNLTSSSANIAWNTNEPSSGRLYFGTSTTLNASSSQVANLLLATTQNMSLSTLASSTTYYFMVEAKDGAGNTATSSVQSFQTL